MEHAVIEWLMPSGVILTSVLGRSSDAPEVRPVLTRQWIPWGARCWRRVGKTAWRGLQDLPPEWGLKGARGGPPVIPGGYLRDPEDGWAEE